MVVLQQLKQFKQIDQQVIHLKTDQGMNNFFLLKF